VDEVAGGGVGGSMELDEGENQRAAKERGYELTWRKAPDGELRFVLARPGEARPGGRPRTARPAETATSAGSRGRQTTRRGRS
jgi:hypothetical protein